MMYNILYPDKRTMSEKQVKSLAADVVTDETGHDCDPKDLDIQDSILILSDAGLVTFENQ